MVDTYIMTGETGSYRFMAPEVFRHEFYDETVDVYSFAMILYNLISGHPPWPNAGGVKAVQAASEGRRPGIPRDWDIGLTSLIERCWDEVPKKRLSFGEVSEALQKYHYERFGGTVEEISEKETLLNDSEAGCGCSIA
jgi:serine/threonine protein kinase